MYGPQIQITMAEYNILMPLISLEDMGVKDLSEIVFMNGMVKVLQTGISDLLSS